MKLFLHIGTEKTGSSFLQSFLANNRSTLSKNGVFYPKAGKREYHMLSNRISPGNAKELNELLRDEKWEQSKTWLLNRIKQAKKDNCDKILLSNEVLIKTFAKSRILHKFIALTKSIDLNCQDFLMFIREPVSQALSLYKHRTKNGNMPPVNQWLDKNYNLANCLDQFYKELKRSPIGLKQYPYQKNGPYLVEMCINKWLNISTVFQVEDTLVNPSLTLSELYLIREIKNKDPYLAKKFYQKMLQISPDEKAKEFDLEEKIVHQINNFMVKYNQTWTLVYNNMSIQLEAKQYSPIRIENKIKSYHFSQIQLSAISSQMIYNSSWSYRIIKTLKKTSSFLAKNKPKFNSSSY